MMEPTPAPGGDTSRSAAVVRPKIDRLAALGIALSLGYPALIYFGRGHIPAYVLAAVLLLLIWMRRTLAFGVRRNAWLTAGGLVLAAAALGTDHPLPLKLYPVVVNGVLLGVFAISLRYPPTIVERIARLGCPDLSERAVAYIRRVTVAWSVFFAANALIALWTSLWASDEVWFYYNGVIAYVLAGLMFAGEWVVRRRALPEYRW
jgi:uncharacterized membrane protein